MQTEDIQNEYLPDFMVRFFQKKADAGDLEELHQWLKSDPNHQRIFDENQDVWMSMHQHTDSSLYNSDLAWDKLFPDIKNNTGIIPEKKVNHLNRNNLFLVAAVVLIAFITGAFSMYFFNHRPPKSLGTFTEHFVPYGSRSMIQLPDGTKIWLNAGSRLTYATDFNVTSREVRLIGEAYFDVKPDAQRPFFVYTPQMNLKVVGTSFNVKAYPEENTIETTVEKGKVLLNALGKQISLIPGQRACLVKQFNGHATDKPSNGNNSGNVKETDTKEDASPYSMELKENVETQLFTSWKDKRWIIEREELGNLAVKIGRRYDVTIEFSDESIKHLIFSGAIEDESLDQVLKVIRLTSPISYVINKKKVLLREDLYLKENLSSRH